MKKTIGEISKSRSSSLFKTHILQIEPSINLQNKTPPSSFSILSLSAEHPLMESLLLCFLLLLLPNYSHSARNIPGAVLIEKKGVFSKAFDPTRVIQLSWQPRAFLYEGFLSDEECDHLINLGKGKLAKSTVIDDVTGLGKPSEERTSSGMFLSYAQVTFAYPLLILNRFPESQESSSQEKDETWSDCAKRGYAVKPRKGDALLFFNLDPDGTPNPTSEHGSCPVIDGEKWSATRWIHVKPFAMPVKACVDEDERCVWWAKQGECEKNPGYMVGNCRKSCKVC